METNDLIQYPEIPYRGLRYYLPQHELVFAGRTNDAEECKDILNASSTAILLLHGRTGCGKSSFLRASLKPHVENTSRLYFLSPSEREHEQDGFSLRSGIVPLRILANAIFALVKRYREGRPPPNLFFDEGNEAVAEKILLGCKNASEYEEYAGTDAERILESITALGEEVKGVPVLIIDQAEEVFTLRPREGLSDDYTSGRNVAGRASSSAPEEESLKSVYPKWREEQLEYYKFLGLFCQEDEGLGIKLILSMRTEYKGQFEDKLAASLYALEGLRGFYLRDLDQRQLIEAIKAPTKVEGGCGPRSKYGFVYESKVVERIVKDLITSEPPGGILPVLQVICVRLYEKTKIRYSSPEWKISEDDYVELGETDLQMEYFLNERLAAMIEKLEQEERNASSFESRRDQQRDNAKQDASQRSFTLEHLGKQNAWKLSICALVRVEPDGRVATRKIAIVKFVKECLPHFSEIAGEKDPQTTVGRIRQGLSILAGENVGVLRFEDGGRSVTLGHDSVGLALLQWKQIYSATIMEQFNRKSNPIVEGRLLNEDQLWNKDYPKEEENRELLILNDLIWDHQIPLFADFRKFSTRLGFSFQEADELKAYNIPRTMHELVSAIDDCRKESSNTLLLLAFPFDQLRDGFDIGEWSDFLVTNIYEGYSLIGKEDMGPGALKDLPKENLEEKLNRLVSILSRIEEKGGSVWIRDEYADKLFKLLIIIVEEWAGRVITIPVTLVRDSDDYGPKDFGPKDPMYEKLRNKPHDMIIGTAISRALADRSGFVPFVDVEDLEPLIDRAVQNEMRRYQALRLLGDIYVHNTWQVGMSVTESLKEQNRSTILRLAAVGFYTMEYILNASEEFVSFVYDQIFRLRDTFPVSPASIRRSIVASYVFLPFEEYGRIVLDEASSKRYRRALPHEVGPVDQVAGESADPVPKSMVPFVYNEMRRLRNECSKGFVELDQYIGKLGNDSAVKRIRELKEIAWNHFRILNFYDAERAVSKAKDIATDELHS